MAQGITAGEIVRRIRGQIGEQWISPSSEGFQCGSEDTKVDGIVTTWTPSIEVLSRAVSQKHNFIISVEPPFWRESGPVKTEVAYGSPPQDLLAKSGAYEYKKKFIDEHGLVLWRFNENYKALPSNPRLNALASALGWSGHEDKPATQKVAKLRAGIVSFRQACMTPDKVC